MNNLTLVLTRILVRIFASIFTCFASIFTCSASIFTYIGRRAHNRIQDPILSLIGMGALSLALTGCENLPAAEGNPIRHEIVVTNLKVPWQVAFAPQRRLLVSERGGQVLSIELNSNRTAATRRNVWLTLSNVDPRGEGGLLGLALHPDFETTPYVYIAYTARISRKSINRLVRYREVQTANGTPRGEFDKILLDNLPAGFVHNGGRLRFHPDGTLFWGVGDAGDTKTAQNTSILAGKILRLDAEGGIPADNPFPGSYVYSYGHRNVQGITFDPVNTGQVRIFANEHGPSGRPCCRDEINQIYAGSNYGWPVITGDESRPGLLTPLLHSGTSTTWAPGGLEFVSTGTWAPSLLMTGLRGRALYRVPLVESRTSGGETRISTQQLEVYFHGEWGRLRDIARAPMAYGFAGDYYVLTSNRDGRGSPTQDDDRIIRLTLP